jgi:hypothetical protein
MKTRHSDRLGRRAAWHTAILGGPYLDGIRILVALDTHGRIIASTGIPNLSAGAPGHFDDWLRCSFNPIILLDAGEEYYAWLDRMSRDALAPAA